MDGFRMMDAHCDIDKAWEEGWGWGRYGTAVLGETSRDMESKTVGQLFGNFDNFGNLV
jgi:hypothetical protein